MILLGNNIHRIFILLETVTVYIKSVTICIPKQATTWGYSPNYKQASIPIYIYIYIYIYIMHLGDITQDTKY